MTRDRLHRAARRQVGALCWRSTGSGETEILLVTSRDTGRWVTPKGNRMAGLKDCQAAAEEAWEEGGVRGVIGGEPIAEFHYLKRLSDHAARSTAVDLYALEVRSELADWPERRERTRRWFSPRAAAEAVDEPDLKAVLASFRPG